MSNTKNFNENLMSNKIPPYLISDQTLNRQEDIYALMEFGKVVNSFYLNDQIYSDNFWTFMKEEFKIKPENITFSCDISTDTKNRVEKLYRYKILVEKPYKILFHFYDHEKVIDNKIYETEDEQKNKISGLMMYFDTDAVEYADNLSSKIRDIVYKQPINRTFYIISSSSMGYELQVANIKDFDIQLELNYGDGFVDKYSEIVDKLKNNKHGLFLFHGEPGCGKTYIIRKLVSDLSEEKTIIYVPSYFMMDIANPELISFISKFKNSVLLLEDAESILTESQEDRTQAVSNILNISDGLLNDHMDMQIIATFNLDRKVIDKALLRKGRLMVDYKFKKLTAKQATKLSEHIGLNKKYDSPATLAEIYEEKVGKQLVEIDDPKKIGFN